LAASAVVDERPELLFSNGLTLQEVELFDKVVRPGHTLPLVLYWQALSPLVLDDLRYTLEVVGQDGEVLRTQSDPPGASWLEQWPAPALVRENTGLYFYPEAQPGRYTLRWQLSANDEPLGVRPPWRPWSTDQALLGSVEVIPWPLETSVPESAIPTAAAFGPQIELAAIEGPQVSDSMLKVTLYWRALAEPNTSYLVFLHFVDAATQEIVSQSDFFPVDGLRPTTGWREGEVLADRYNLPLPSDLPEGEYLLNVGLYDADSGERLPVIVDGVEQPGGQLNVARLQLP
jgi:hypothetical protein